MDQISCSLWLGVLHCISIKINQCLFPGLCKLSFGFHLVPAYFIVVQLFHCSRDQYKYCVQPVIISVWLSPGPAISRSFINCQADTPQFYRKGGLSRLSASDCSEVNHKDHLSKIPKYKSGMKCNFNVKWIIIGAT